MDSEPTGATGPGSDGDVNLPPVPEAALPPAAEAAPPAAPEDPPPPQGSTVGPTDVATWWSPEAAVPLIRVQAPPRPARREHDASSLYRPPEPSEDDVDDPYESAGDGPALGPRYGSRQFPLPPLPTVITRAVPPPPLDDPRPPMGRVYATGEAAFRGPVPPNLPVYAARPQLRHSQYSPTPPSRRPSLGPRAVVGVAIVGVLCVAMALAGNALWGGKSVASRSDTPNSAGVTAGNTAGGPAGAALAPGAPTQSTVSGSTGGGGAAPAAGNASAPAPGQSSAAATGGAPSAATPPPATAPPATPTPVPPPPFNDAIGGVLKANGAGSCAGDGGVPYFISTNDHICTFAFNTTAAGSVTVGIGASIAPGICFLLADVSQTSHCYPVGVTGTVTLPNVHAGTHVLLVSGNGTAPGDVVGFLGSVAHF